MALPQPSELGRTLTNSGAYRLALAPRHQPGAFPLSLRADIAAPAPKAFASRTDRRVLDVPTGRRARPIVMTAAPPLHVRGRDLDTSRPLVMGIVNASPDSFSDVGGGRHVVADQVDRALGALDCGADLIDVGGQSGITGVPEISEETEIDRVIPVVRGIVAARPDAVISVDTYRPRVTEAVLDAGAALINDVSCLRYPEVAQACAAAGAGLIVMHTKVPPKHRLQDPAAYADVADEVATVLAERLGVALRLGVAARSVIVDPGVDYAKTPHQTISMLRHLDPVRALRRPVLYALSRKDFIGALTARPPQDRGPGTLAAIGHVGWHPGSIFRVHDVAATIDYLNVARALAGAVEVHPDLALPDRLRWSSGRAGRAPTSGLDPSGQAV